LLDELNTGLKFEDVPVPELGDADTVVRIRELSGNERVEYNDYVQSFKTENVEDVAVKDIINIMSKIVQITMVDPVTGKRVLSDSQVNVLNSKSPDVITRLATKALELSGMKPEQLEEAKNSLKNDQS